MRGLVLRDRRWRNSAAAAMALAAAALFMAAPAAAQITVTDDFDRTVTLAAPAQRIVSLAPHNTENLFSAGAGARVVAVVAHSDYPPAALRIPSIGSHVQFNLEALVALNPDLVVAWESAKNRETMRKIERLGYAVYYSEPRDFEDIIENIEELAQLAGSAASIDPPVAALRAELARLRARYADAAPLSVFYQVWNAPLMTLGGGHFISRVLEVCGARNIFAESKILAPRVSVEAVVRADPDIIIGSRVHGRASDDMAFWKKWRSMRAIAGDGIVFVDADVMHRHTARMIMGIGTVCESIDQVRRGDRERRGTSPAAPATEQ